MKYKIGDEVLLKAKIVDIDESKVYPYNLAVKLGDTWETDDYCCEESAIIGKYEKASTDPGLTEKKCSCFKIENNKSVCQGTKEKDVCSCNGDKTKCDFYSDVREKAAGQDRVVTAEEYRQALYEISYNMTITEVTEAFNSAYLCPFKELVIKDVLTNYTSAHVVNAIKKWKDEHTVHRYDILKNKESSEEWLVTCVIDDLIYLINKKGKTNFITQKVFVSEYEKTGETGKFTYCG